MELINKIQKLEIKDIVLQYSIIRWILILLYLFSIISLLRYSFYVGVFETDFFFDKLWFDYCTEYWFTHLNYLITITAFILIITFGIGWKNRFIEKYQYLQIPITFYHTSKSNFYIFYNFVLPFLILTYLSFHTFPSIHLAYNNSLILFLIQAISVSLIIFRFFYPIYKEYYLSEKPISKHYHKNISYNTSSLGILSEECKNEQKVYESIEKKQINHFALISGDKNYPSLSYKGFKSVFPELSRLVEGEKISTNYHKFISLHSKTTTAFKHILNLIEKAKPSEKIEIVHSDAEYGTILDAIHEFSNKKECKTHELSFKKQIFNDGFSIDQIYNEYINQANKISQNEGVKIIVITHVYSESGIALTKLPDLLNKLKEFGNNIITIIDGAQALGNIFVNKDVLGKCDFYISCGHKWLLGSKTRGIAFYNPKSPFVESLENSDLFEKSRSFSYFEYNPDHRSDETVSLHPDITLTCSLKNFNSINKGMLAIEQHNSLLADTFRSAIYGKKYIKQIPHKSKGGIVTLKVDQKFSISKELIKHNIDFEEFENGSIIRFSFHFYMGIKHVNKLIAILDKISNDNKYS